MCGVAQADSDIVVAALHAEHGFGRTIEKGAVDRREAPTPP